MLIEPATAADLATVGRGTELAAADLAVIEPHVRVGRLARGAFFLEAGDRAVWCGTALVGLVREYFPTDDGREVTRGFAGPGDYVGSLSDLLVGAAARSS